MNISMQLAVVVAAACLCLADGAPDGRLTRKQQRPTRGFKNVEMMTARGFGKRDRAHTRTERDLEQSSSERASRSTPTFMNPSNMQTARDFGKRSSESNEVMDADDFLEIFGSAPEKENQENGEDNKTIESIPVELFVMEMLNRPEFTRSVVNKFIDVNQDRMLSLEELFRNEA